MYVYMYAYVYIKLVHVQTYEKCRYIDTCAHVLRKRRKTMLLHVLTYLFVYFRFFRVFKLMCYHVYFFRILSVLRGFLKSPGG